MKIAYLLGSLNRGGTETLLLDVFRRADAAPFPFMGVHRKGGAYEGEFYATSPEFVQCQPVRHNQIAYLIRLRKVLQSRQITIMYV